MNSKDKYIRGKRLDLIQRRINNYTEENGDIRGKEEFKHYLFPNGISVAASELFPDFSVLTKVLSSLRFGFPAVLYCQIPNAIIRVKNNIRINFKDDAEQKKISAKISLPAPGYRIDSLAREIKARKIIKNNASSINVPELYNYDSKLRWFNEQYINPVENVSPGDLVEKFLLEYSIDLYKPFVKSRYVKDTLPRLGITKEQLKAVFNEVGLNLSEQIFYSMWPVSFIHGDLSPGNMILSERGRVFLIDWEKFKVGPISFDFKKLFSHRKELVFEILEKLSTLTASESLDPATQMNMILGAELIKLREKRDKKIKYKVEHLNQTRKQAYSQVKNKEREILSNIEK